MMELRLAVHCSDSALVLQILIAASVRCKPALEHNRQYRAKAAFFCILRTESSSIANHLSISLHYSEPPWTKLSCTHSSTGRLLTREKPYFHLQLAGQMIHHRFLTSTRSNRLVFPWHL